MYVFFSCAQFAFDLFLPYISIIVYVSHSIVNFLAWKKNVQVKKISGEYYI